MERNLSKKDKAALRQLIEKGVQAEYTHALEEVETILKHWRGEATDNREAYQTMYRSIHENNKFIARRYDHIGGSSYVPTVVSIYRDKQITEDDLSILSEDLREYIKRIGSFLDK